VSRLAPPDARETQLLERDSELSAMESALAAAGVGHGSVVIIEGEAGIGKTTLLDRAAAEASRAGMLVLRAAATELEQPDPYGVAASLFAPALRPPMERRAFRGAAERARAGASRTRLRHWVPQMHRQSDMPCTGWR
jgi:predicted ATPase